MIHTVNITSSVSRNAGGLFESVRRLVQELSLIPMDVSVLGVSDEFTKLDISDWNPICVYASKPLLHRQFGYSPNFLKFLDLHNPDIMHSHGIWTYSSIVTRSFSNRNKIPYMISPHGMIDPWALKNSYWKKFPAYYLYERSHLNGASCLRALCESEAAAFRKFGLKNPIAIIPNGIDMRDEQQGQRGATGGKSGSDRRKLLFLGRIHPKKGLINLIKAWSKTRNFLKNGERGAQWQLVIAGWEQGGHQRELKRLCGELGLSVWVKKSDSNEASSSKLIPDSADIIFYGSAFGREKDELLQLADAFILPSFSEGLPMAVLEAWAYGLPVVMTPECNLPEGFAADAAIKIGTDAASITEGVDSLLSMEDNDLNAMGARGRELVRERFTWKIVAEQMSSTYEWILGGGEMPGCIVT